MSVLTKMTFANIFPYRIIKAVFSRIYRRIPIDRNVIKSFLAWKTLWRQAKVRHDASAPVCIAFDVCAAVSLSQTGRDFIEKLSRTGIPFTVFDTRTTSPDMPRIDYSPPNESREIVASSILHFSTDSFPKPHGIPNAITPFWEFESGMTEARPFLFKNVSTAIVFSDFCKCMVQASVPKHTKVIKIRYPFTLPAQRTQGKDMIRKAIGLSVSDFIVFFNFDFRSGYNRKNPQAVISAFARALKGVSSAKLLFKVSGAEFCANEFKDFSRLIETAGIQKQTVVIDGYLPHEQVLDAIYASDVYLSLHRGEGLGLGMLEAMSVGTPVICTNYGGNTEFCNGKTAFLVNYTLQPCTDDFFMYRFVKKWAEPDIEEAAKYLVAIKGDPQLGFTKAFAAMDYIAKYYTLDGFMNDVNGHIIRHWK